MTDLQGQNSGECTQCSNAPVLYIIAKNCTLWNPNPASSCWVYQSDSVFLVELNWVAISCARHLENGMWEEPRYISCQSCRAVLGAIYCTGCPAAVLAGSRS